jgi:hypothetical protein
LRFRDHRLSLQLVLTWDTSRKGNVAIPSKWWNPVHAIIRYVDGRTVELDDPFESTGFNYEVGHFCDLLRSRRTESPIIWHDMSPDDEHPRSCPSRDRPRVPPGALGESLAYRRRGHLDGIGTRSSFSNDHCTKKSARGPRRFLALRRVFKGTIRHQMRQVR